MDRSKFLQTLFDEGQQTCFAKDAYGTIIKPAPEQLDVFFSINAMHTSRADANVVCYRNFLLELDSVPLEQQISLVTSKLPVTAITFSGGKSYHFIVSLIDPVSTETDYRRIVRGLMETVPEADRSTKNPSRLSRLPFAIRPETGLVQDLVYLGSRIALDELPKPAPYHEPKETPKNIQFVNSQLLEVLHTGVDNYISGHFSGRNQFFYWLGRRLSELNQTKDQKKQMVDKFYERLENKKKFTKVEAYAAARVKF
jgi:hypothetical protein